MDDSKPRPRIIPTTRPDRDCGISYEAPPFGIPHTGALDLPTSSPVFSFPLSSCSASYRPLAPRVTVSLFFVRCLYLLFFSWWLLRVPEDPSI